VIVVFVFTAVWAKLAAVVRTRRIRVEIVFIKLFLIVVYGVFPMMYQILTT
jgi:hypothetical protein